VIALRRPTDPRWIRLALERFDEVLVDHAHCEKKAAAHALSMLTAYFELPGLARAMSRLAREEAGHLTEVIRLLEKRGLSIGRDRGDPYAKSLYQKVRTTGPSRRLDQLLVSAVIEARSEERLRLLAENLLDPELREFYRRLSLAEAGHGNLFVKLAQRASPDECDARLGELLDLEAQLIRELPIRPAVH
jgi:tRNA 2-(methylsulfanyl)-N6-isopentenyladenosine37 hydroxylase